MKIKFNILKRLLSFILDQPLFEATYTVFCPIIVIILKVNEIFMGPV